MSPPDETLREVKHPTPAMLNSPIKTLCKQCRYAGWCSETKQCLVARLDKSEAFYKAKERNAE